MNPIKLAQKVRDEYYRKLAQIDEAELWLRDDRPTPPKYERKKEKVGAGSYQLIKFGLLALIP